MKDRNMSS